MERAVTEARTRSPEEKMWIGIIQQAFEDAFELGVGHNLSIWMLYTSDASDDRSSVDLGVRRITKKKHIYTVHI